MNYQERRQQKIERYKTYAANARKRAQAYSKQSQSIRNVIPFGQPILVGHHSERRHRRDLDRVHRYIQKEMEETKKADYWERRVKAILNSTAISSQDPKALPKLREKLHGLEQGREQMKAFNKAWRAGGVEAVKAAKFPEHLIKAVTTNVGGNELYDIPFPPYTFSNLSSNIRRVKERITALGIVSH